MITEEDRFEAGAPAYAAYLQSTEGKLRLDLAWDNLRAILQKTNSEGTKRALDVGGGTGAMAVRLAAEGWQVAVVDASGSMLALAAEAARRSEVSARMTFHQADAATITELFAPHSFDLVICHNVIEYVADPSAVIRTMRIVARPTGLISILARNRAGEAMRAALKSHDFSAAEHALTADYVRESLYGGPARLFDPLMLRALAAEALLDVIAERGVRVLADYLPASLLESAEGYERLRVFENRLGTRADFAAVARYTQIIAKVPDNSAR